MGQQEKIGIYEIGRHEPARDRVGPAVPPATAPGPAVQEAPLWRRVTAVVLQGLLALAIVASSYAGYRAIMAGAPVAERTERPRIARLVETAPAVARTQAPVIEARGQVVAAQMLVVRPRVGGTLEWVSPRLTPGGIVSAGEPLARIDRRTLALAVDRAEAEIAGIEARIRMEEGQAAVARRDLERLPRNLTDEQRGLVLREPQMAQLAAELAAARATLEAARIDLDEAEIVAPFDAVVMSEEAAPGARVSEGAELARIVATDRFEVVLAVPASVLDWVDPAAGQPVAIRQPSVWPEGVTREGRVARLGAALSDTGRMAELIVEVPDPLALEDAGADAPMLLLGSYVSAAVEAMPVEGAVAIERAWLRDGDTVWVMARDDTLEVRPVDVAWRGAETVLIRDGLAAGERIVTSPLAMHAPGMALRTRDGVGDEVGDGAEG